MLKLLLGTDWIANRDCILQMIAKDVAEKKGGRVLMVPELISHDMERRLCARAGDTSSRFAEVLSFTRLSRRVADFAGHAADECLDDGGRVVAMAAAIRQIHSHLKAYASVETKPEFLTGLVDAVDEFKRCCITADDLMAASKQSEGVFSQKLEELSLLLQAYDGLCARGKRDPRDQLTLLLEELETTEFSKQHVFYFDGFQDFSRQQMDIISHLICTSAEVTVGLTCDKVDTQSVAFERAADTAGQLISCARDAGVEVSVSYVEPQNNALNHVNALLFRGLTKDLALGDRLRVYKTDSIHTECTAAAERIIEMVRQGARYRDFGVVCADMPLYQNGLNMIFHRCGIPVYISGTEDILSKSVVVTVLSAMDAALGGFEQKDVLRYLRSVLSPLDMETCDVLENYAILWSIDGKRWIEKWENHPLGLGERWDDVHYVLLDKLNEARCLALQPLRNLRDGFDNAKNLGQQVMCLYKFFEDINLSQRLSDLADRLDAKGDFAQSQILNQLWDILLIALEQMHDVLGNSVWDAETFTHLFRLLLSQYDVGTIPPVLDAVSVGSVDAMRCHETKHLIILGAVEGSLPSYGSAVGVLSDRERAELRQMGIPLNGGSLEMLQTEFAQIYDIFCGASESITVSCATGQPSFLFNRLSNLSGGEISVNCNLGAAMTDKTEAAAYLARWNMNDVADDVGIYQEYDEVSKRRAHELGSIKSENVKKLYGPGLRLSASQIDRQAECRLSYFLRYGLRAKERKAATIDPAEFGTYVHAVLEQTLRHIVEMGGIKNVSLEQTIEIARSCSQKYAQERFEQINTERLSYLFKRNGRELEMIVSELWEELRESAFDPVGFEVAFGGIGELPAVDISGKNMQAHLRGFVDRVDTWKSDKATYFRVVDYKTGKKDFDYCDIVNGLGLQMLLYMFALEQEGTELLGDCAVPAGVQYFPARVPIVSADGMLSDEEARAIREKNWKRKGLLLLDEDVLQAMEPGEHPKKLPYSRKKDGSISGDIADGKQFDLLKKYIFHLLGNMVDDIASGNIEPNPYTRGSSHDACEFCPYGTICHSSIVQGRRNYRGISAQEFWDHLEKEMNKDG